MKLIEPVEIFGSFCAYSTILVVSGFPLYDLRTSQPQFLPFTYPPFAAFTALSVFLPGIIGVAVGRWRIDRQFEKTPEAHHGLGVKAERGDGDVFTAARGDETAAGVAHESQTAPTAVATSDHTCFESSHESH